MPGVAIRLIRQLKMPLTAIRLPVRAQLQRSMPLSPLLMAEDFRCGFQTSSYLLVHRVVCCLGQDWCLPD